MTDDRAPRARGRREQFERQWRELAGTGRTQVSASSAVRARDADQPTAQELEQAEAELVLQRRHWKPTN